MSLIRTVSFRLLVILFIQGLLLVHGSTLPADEVSLQGDFGRPRVIVPAPKNPEHAHLSWPKIVTAENGDLVVGYIAGRFHGTHGEGCPAVSVSRDGGKSFSDPKILKQYTAKDKYTSAGNLALGLAKNGSVVLLSMAFRGNEANTIDGWISDDHGKSWEVSDTSRLDHNQTGSVYGNVMQVPERGLAVVGHYRRGSKRHEQGLWLSWSQDDGKSWQKPEMIIDRHLVEPAVIFSQGTFLGLIRTGTRQDYYEQIQSKDYGQHWQHAKRGFAPEYKGARYLPSPCLVTDPEHPGRVYCLASERHAEDNPSGLIGRIVLWQAELPELKWRERGVVAKFPRALGERKDITYAWMAPLGDDHWYVVFYCGRTHGASDIFGLEITVPED